MQHLKPCGYCALRLLCLAATVPCSYCAPIPKFPATPEEFINLLEISGWVNQFLSWEGFEPLAKLSYNIYLIHGTVVFCLTGKMQFTYSMSNLVAVIFFVLVSCLMPDMKQRRVCGCSWGSPLSFRSSLSLSSIEAL